MKQKLDDLKMMVQGSRKVQVLVLIGILAVLFLLFAPSAPKRRARVAPQVEEQSPLVAKSEASKDILNRFKSEVEQLRKQNEETRKEIVSTQRTVRDYEKRTAEILKKFLDRMAESEQQTPTMVGVPPVEMQDDPYAGGDLEGEEKLDSFGDLEEPEIGPPPLPPVQKAAFVGVGDSVRVKLLSGVNAPTDGTPYPVVFQLVGDVYGPDGSTLPLGEARLVAAAQGSLTDSRALFRLTSLNISLPSGERKVYEVDGWVVGEDGIRGMRGVLIDPIGKAIAGSAIAGAIDGAGQGLQRANQQIIGNQGGGFSVITDGSLTDFAAGQSASSAAREWSSIIRQRLNSLVPVVEVLSGREGTAVFAKNLAIEGLFEALEDEEYQYASLD